MSFDKKKFLEFSTSLKTEEVEFPGVGKIIVREMTAGDRDAYDFYLWKLNESSKSSDPESLSSEIKMRRLAPCLVNGKGDRLFSVAELKRMRNDVIDKLVTVADRLNGMEKDAEELAVKN